MKNNGDKLANTMSDVKNIIERAEVLESELDAKQTKIADADAEIGVLQARLKESESRVEELVAENAQLSEEITKIEKSAEEMSEQINELTEEEAKVEVKVMEELQQIGVEPVSLQAEGSSIDHVAEFKAITNPVEKTNYYRENKEKILGGLK